ncbi:hypothetical protein VNO77_34057 [Canavalia gladiata]|uniref:Uncharacterized protein n=1 Tax=Canavalia gladiata TaxID=3824 RepID=A0AAN9KDP4_CANGL
MLRKYLFQAWLCFFNVIISSISPPNLRCYQELHSKAVLDFFSNEIETDMHLWPTKNLRDSFKLSYLVKLEWNYRRMERDQQSSNEQNLLVKEIQANVDSPKLTKHQVSSFFQELLLLLSCCYCCFCCGACIDDK